MKHQFAFYLQGLTEIISSLSVGQNLALSDQTLFHRLFRVVRVAVGDTVIFFDQQNNVVVELLAASGKKDFSGVMVKKEQNKKLQPSICFWLPLLKREHFQTALYSLAELGVNQIQPVLVQKGQRKWGGQKEAQRSEKILIAAAEQSKNFSFPELLEPKTLQECCQDVQSDAKKLFFDPEGQSFSELIPKLQGKALALLVGPEGDLTETEKKLLQQNNFLFCSLTPTVLRAVQAAAISAGVCRIFLNR